MPTPEQVEAAKKEFNIPCTLDVTTYSLRSLWHAGGILAQALRELEAERTEHARLRSAFNQTWDEVVLLKPCVAKLRAENESCKREAEQADKAACDFSKRLAKAEAEVERLRGILDVIKRGDCSCEHDPDSGTLEVRCDKCIAADALEESNG